MKNCSVTACERKHVARGLCQAHYARLSRFGSVRSEFQIGALRIGSFNSKWKGGKTNDGKGRVLIYLPEHPNANSWGYVYRYRIVMEKHIGRLLKSNEVIHHIDGNCSNDTLENLELMNPGDHARRHINDMHNEKWLSANISRNRDSSGRYT